MKVNKIVNQTTCRSEFNRAYKRYLEGKGKIRCSFCKYHRGENDDKKWYGGFKDKNKLKMRYPNWKMVSKNRKQWMKNPMMISEERYSRFSERIYIDITW